MADPVIVMLRRIVLANSVCFLLLGLTTAQQKRAEPNPLRAEATLGVKSRVSPPEPILTPDPDYPLSLRTGKSKADTVELQLKVDDRGKVLDGHVTRSSDKRLNQNAIDAVKRWKFKPAMKDGKPVGVFINVEVNYRLLSH